MWFRKKQPKHRHNMHLVYAGEVPRFNKITKQFDLSWGIEWVRRCECGLSKNGIENMSYAAFIAANGHPTRMDS